ncbi:MAG: hypothetical protein WKF36_00365 [Candidatus Nitrosocosmicus sp.]
MKKSVILITIILITIGITYFSYTYLISDFYLDRDNIVTKYKVLNESNNLNNNNNSPNPGIK